LSQKPLFEILQVLSRHILPTTVAEHYSLMHRPKLTLPPG